MFPTMYRVDWPFGSGGETKKEFQDGRHGGDLAFPIETSLAVFDLQITPMSPT